MSGKCRCEEDGARWPEFAERRGLAGMQGLDELLDVQVAASWKYCFCVVFLELITK